jgi:hypothetical protein
MPNTNTKQCIRKNHTRGNIPITLLCPPGAKTIAKRPSESLFPALILSNALHIAH